MEKYDMIKKLHEKAGISEEDARDALERANWDMLDALMLLEKEGKIAPLTASMTTVEKENAYEDVDAEILRAEGKSRGGCGEGFSSIAEKLKKLLLKTIENSLVVRRRGKESLSVPVLIVIIAAFVNFSLLAFAFVVGFLFECSYAIEKRS